jgi:single-stranded-DNA-specific exonuclease
VRLEVNHWNGAVEPRVVLRELYRREESPAGDAEATDEIDSARLERAEQEQEWWERFEAELNADLEAWPHFEETATSAEKSERQLVRGANAPAALLAELVSSGESVLALSADAGRRSELAIDGLELADYATLEGTPDLACRFDHVVLLDPPPFAHVEWLVRRPRDGAGTAPGYLHPAWGEAEHRFALIALESRLARRSELATVFRELRDAGADVSGPRLREALQGGGPHPRSPESAACCFRVLAELGLVQGTPDRGGGMVGVVSSDRTDLERSAAFRAYSARCEEGRQYLERRKQP